MPLDALPKLEVASDARFDHDAWVVAVRGDVDMLSVEHVAAVLQASAQGRDHLVVDLSQVDFFGAAGLSAVAKVARQLKEAGGAVTVRVGSPLVQRLFEITDVGALVHLTRDVIDAPPLVQDRLFNAAMTMLARSAQTAIRSVEASSVTMNRGASFVTVAATDPVAFELDLTQYAAGNGPCVQAATHGHVVQANASSGADFWAAISEDALRAGIHAVLSTPIIGAGTPIGALNLYSSNDAFTEGQCGRALALVTDMAAFVTARGNPSARAQAVSS
jgi:anti-anti-sigma factor